MGKQYFCDYCNRSFADGAENRKKHLVSLHHQKMRKTHYDMFRDATTILAEESKKNPCRKFHQNGSCEYGSGCKYSHLTTADFQTLKEQAMRQENPALGSEISCPSDAELKDWLENVLKKKGEKELKNLNLLNTPSNPPLPEVLKNIPNLPPSLIPSKPLDNLKDNLSEWGK